MKEIPSTNGQRVKVYKVFWIFALLVVAALGCGEKNQPTTEPKHYKLASAAFSIRWMTPATDEASVSTPITKAAISQQCADVGVEYVECKVYDDVGSPLVTGGPWPCSQGQGKIEDIAPGTNRQFVVIGLDKDQTVIYQGQTAEGVLIEEGKTATVPPIEAYPFLSPMNLSTETFDTHINLSWTASAENTGITGYLIHNADGEVIGDTPVASYIHSDLKASTGYCYAVTSHDHFNNSSKQSDLFCTDTTNSTSDTGQAGSYTDTPGEDADDVRNPPTYTKLDASGTDLNVSAIDWVMVRDDVTGLIWEVKKAVSGDLHDSSNTYTFESAQSTFIDGLNTERFGGFNDWRLPSQRELATLFNATTNTGAAIDTVYFPQTNSAKYATSTTFAATWGDCVDGACWWYVNFQNGCAEADPKTTEFHVRAVRGAPKTPELVNNSDAGDAERTFTDKTTGLMWQSNFPYGPTNTRTWEQSVKYCDELTFAGHDDWRMPNIKELQSIIDHGKTNPASDPVYYPPNPTDNNFSPDYFWSSTTYRSNSTQAYKISFNNGSVFSHVKTASTETGVDKNGDAYTHYYYVRAVRTVTPDE